jgi:NADH-ubiquinone oxidoreductase chain 6
VVGVVTGLLADNFVYSYILFLVILGGVLVLFIYITSLVSNEVFSLT